LQIPPEVERLRSQIPLLLIREELQIPPERVNCKSLPRGELQIPPDVESLPR
jgi:hypothetical protein